MKRRQPSTVTSLEDLLPNFSTKRTRKNSQTSSASKKKKSTSKLRDSSIPLTEETATY
jgi:hypothetical protein